MRCIIVLVADISAVWVGGRVERVVWRWRMIKPQEGQGSRRLSSCHAMTAHR